jgi:hypothetical protein
MASLMGELVERCKDCSAYTVRWVHIHLLLSARSILGRALMRHHKSKIMPPDEGDDLRIGVELRDVTATVEGDPNGSN